VYSFSLPSASFILQIRCDFDLLRVDVKLFGVTRRRFRRVAQPRINPAGRDVERHTFWPGFAAALVGLGLVGFGARHLTAIETVDGGKAQEVQLMKAYASGGLQFPKAPPPPPDPGDPAALERWVQQYANAAAPTWKVRVDTAATTPCPT
jgi:hypothetical protein